MQNFNQDHINLQHKCIVVISKPKYRINNVFRWVTQAVQTKKLSSKSTLKDIQNLKKELADQTALRLNRFLKSNSNTKGVLFDPYKDCIETPYYVIGDNLSSINVNGIADTKNDRNYISNDLYSNDRIVSCSVTQETDNGWSCNVVLNNTDDIYTLQNEYYYNSKTGLANTNLGSYVLNQQNVCVIEPNDEINIYMSDWTGNLNAVFTGLVSSVSLADDGLNKTVNLQCDDMFKKLSWTYKVVKASFDTEEAFGTTLNIYEQNYANLPMSEVIKYLLGEAVCDIYKRDTFLLDAVKCYIQNKEGDKNVSLSKRIQQEIDKYIEKEKLPKELAKGKVGTTQTVAGRTFVTGTKGVSENNVISLIGYKCTIDYKNLLTATTQAVAGQTFVTGYKVTPVPMTDYKKGDIAFKISGMEQPVWAWTINSGSFDFLFSTFKRNDTFIREIANIVAYEVFADVCGIIKFRPPNFTLPRRACYKNKEFSQAYNDYITNYIVSQDLEEKYFTNITTTRNDNAIYTLIEVSGSFVENNISNPFMRAKAYAGQQYINKYGIRMMSPVSRVGLTTPEACVRYGELLLWRQNKNYELGSATCILNSNYTVGMPIYINKHVAVWYIKRVEHSFTAGQLCTTTITLGYKRVPLCYKKDLENFLSQSLEQGQMTQTEIDKVRQNKQYLTWGILDLKYSVAQKANLSNYLLVWEMVPMELFEDIMIWQSQVEGSKDRLIHNRKVNFVLTTKSKALQSLLKYIEPPSLDTGVSSGVNVSNGTFTTSMIEKKQKESILTTDAQIENTSIATPQEILTNSQAETPNSANAVLLQPMLPPPMPTVSVL